LLISVLALFSMSSLLWAQETDKHAKFKRKVAGSDSVVNRTQPAGERKFLMVDGRPFFAIGSYGPPAGTDKVSDNPWKVIHENGWNCSIVNPWKVVGDGKTVENANLVLNKDAIAAMTRAAKEVNHKFVVITEGHWRLHGLERPNNDKYLPARQKLLKKRIEDLRTLPDELMQNVIGFHHYDEPENMFAAGWRKERTGETIQEWCLKKVGWEYDLLKSAFPDIPVTGVIAWGVSYPMLNVKGFCDINIPNSYPTWRRTNSPSELVVNPPNYSFVSVPADAREAVTAAIVNGMPLPIYMPFGCSDIGLADGRQGTLAEVQYQFFAPVTQGVMGIMYWASYRSDIAYAETTIFPVTRALRDMSPFFTGRWIDDKILSYSPNESTTEKTKKVSLPDVSCILRESEDGQVLLLAVNNTSEKKSVTFELGIRWKAGREYFTGNPVDASSNVIADTMPKYGVRAYILKP